MKFILFICMLLVTTMAFATGLAPVPEVDLFAKLSELLMSWSSLGSLSKGVLIILILTQIIKQMTDFEYKRLLVVILSVIYGVFQLMIGDTSFGSAVVITLISGGGAVALYVVCKPFLKSFSFLDFLKLGKK